MLTSLRRRRWIAALLIAVSPGVLGGAAALAHPCPVDAPWMASVHAHPAAVAHTPGMTMPAGASHAPGHDAGAHPACHCIGCCATPPLTVAPTVAVAVVEVDAPPRTPVWRVIEAGDELRPAVDLLPETTAPPLV